MDMPVNRNNVFLYNAEREITSGSSQITSKGTGRIGTIERGPFVPIRIKEICVPICSLFRVCRPLFLLCKNVPLLFVPSLFLKQLKEQKNVPNTKFLKEKFLLESRHFKIQM